MPAKSKKQANLFRAALGDPKPGTGAAKIKATVSHDKIKDFTHTEGIDEADGEALQVMRAVNTLANYIIAKGDAGTKWVEGALQKRVQVLKQKSDIREEWGTQMAPPMKLSNLIKALYEMKKAHGDVVSSLVDSETGNTVPINGVYPSYPLTPDRSSVDRTKPANEIVITTNMYKKSQVNETLRNLIQEVLSEGEEEKLSGAAYDREDKWHKDQARIHRTQIKGITFFDVKPGQEADAQRYGLTQFKNGSWGIKHVGSREQDFGVVHTIETKFGPGKYWQPKN